MANTSRKEALRAYIIELVGAEVDDDTRLESIGYDGHVCVENEAGLEEAVNCKCDGDVIINEDTTFAQFAEYIDRMPARSS